MEYYLTFLYYFIWIFITICITLYELYLKYNYKPIVISQNNSLIDYKSNILNEIKKRLNLLTRKNLNYNDWLTYNQENNVCLINNEKLYIFIFQYIPKSDKMVAKVHGNPNYIDFDWDDIIKDQDNIFSFINEKVNPDLISIMYDLASNSSDNSDNIQYYWTDPIQKILVKKRSYFMKYVNPSNPDITGIIGMGYTEQNLISNDKIYYINRINNFQLIIVNFCILLCSLLIFILNKHILKSILFYIISFVFVYHFVNLEELEGSYATEIEKINQMNSNILGISFLIGINTFILTSFSNKVKILFTETGFLFSISVILLLLAAYNHSNYSTIIDIMNNRISDQYLFNYCILVNIFIIFNFIYYLIYKI